MRPNFDPKLGDCRLESGRCLVPRVGARQAACREVGREIDGLCLICWPGLPVTLCICIGILLSAGASPSSRPSPSQTHTSPTSHPSLALTRLPYNRRVARPCPTIGSAFPSLPLSRIRCRKPLVLQFVLSIIDRGPLRHPDDTKVWTFPQVQNSPR